MGLVQWFNFKQLKDVESLQCDGSNLASKKVSLIGEQLEWLVQLYPGTRLESQEYTRMILPC